eukprot:3865245-Alexandrium_andersonii.AAC.1
MLGPTEDGVGYSVSQEAYSEERLEPVKIRQGLEDDAPDNEEERCDNMSATGGLCWLANRTRPELSCGTAVSQKHQSRPYGRDLRRTNRLIRQARRDPAAGCT